MDKQFFTINEAAKLLGVSIKTLRRWDEKGLLRAQRTIGNQRRYDIEELEKLKGKKIKSAIRKQHTATTARQLSIAEAAALLGISIKTLRRWEAKGIIASHRSPTNQRYFMTTELNALKNAKTEPEVFEPQPQIIQPSIEPTPKIPFNPTHPFALPHLKFAQTVFPVIGIIIAIVALGGTLTVTQLELPLERLLSYLPKELQGIMQKESENQVLQSATARRDLAFKISVPVEMLSTASVSGNLTAPNIVYSVLPGDNITISGDPQNPTISANISDLESIGLLAGDGISFDGNTITNTAPGTAVDVFANILVGSTTISAGSNTDIFELAAGDNITLTTDTGSKKITIAASGGSSGGISGIEVLEGGTTVSDEITTLDFLDGDFDVGESPSGEANIQLAATLTSVTGVAGNFSIGGTTTLNGLTYSWPGSQGSNYILQTDGAGTLTWIDAGSLPNSDKWDSTNGAIYPKNAATLDLLIGGVSSQSARFHAYGPLNAGTTPSASISAHSNFAGLVVDNSTGDLFTASSSGLTRFVINQTGNLQFTGNTAFLQTLTTSAADAKTYNFPDLIASSADICLSSGNCAGVGGTGDVLGPGSSTDNAIVRFNGSTGKSIQNSAVIIDDSNNVTGVNSLTAAPASDITALTLTGTNTTSQNLAYFNAHNASGTIFNISYGNTQTLTGALIGQAIDLNNGQLTATNFDVTGSKITLPTVTNTNAAGTIDLLGLQVTFGAGAGINQNGAGATIYSALDVLLPALTQTQGTLTANGLAVTTPSSITTGGVANGLLISPTGVGAGTLNGVNIATISASGNGNETALHVGSGWDTVLRVNGTPVINGQGVTLATGGGTGQATYTTGDILYANGTNTLDKLAIGGSDDYVLKVSGGVPSWGTITGDSCTTCVITDPSSSATNTIAPTGQSTTGLIVRQTSTASPTNDIFQVTNAAGDQIYFRIDNDGNVYPSSAIGDTLTLTPNTDTTALTLVGTNVTTANLQYINANNQSGNIFNLNYGASQTLSTTTPVNGIAVDLSTNVTATNANVTGTNLTLPGTTNTHTSGLKELTGVSVQAGGGINQNGIGGTTTFAAFDATIPPLTQTAGTLNGYGVNVTTPSSITTGGTAAALNVAASGVGAGSLYGLNISGITAGAGTETALAIGSGWDTVLSLNGTTIIDGSGNLNVANTTGILAVANGGSPFEQNLGAIFPRIPTQDLLLGGVATTSASFHIYGSINAGTNPVASIAATSSFAGLVVDNSGSGDIFTASSSGLTRFVIKNNGNVGIGTTLPSANLHVVQTSTQEGLRVNSVSAGLNSAFSVYDPSGSVNLAYLGAFRSTSIYGGLAAFDSPALGVKADVGDAISLRVGNLSGLPLYSTAAVASISGQTSFATLVVDNNGAGDLFTASSSGLERFTIRQNGTIQLSTVPYSNCTALETVNGLLTCGSDDGGLGGGSNWTLDTSLGTLRPNHSTVDLLIGGASTSSAKFVFSGVAGSSTPIASISADPSSGTTTGLALNGTGTIQSLNMHTLTLGGSTTGNIILSPRNSAAGGFVAPGADNLVDLGSSTSARFSSLYLGPSSLHIQCATGDGCGQTLDYALTVNTTSDNLQFRVNNNTRMVLSQGGNVGIGETAPVTKLQVDGGADATLTGINGYLTVGEITSTNLVFDNDELMARSNGAVNELNIQLEGGDVDFGSAADSTNVGINFDGTIDATLDVEINSVDGGTAAIGSFRGTTSFAALLINQSGVGDLFAASDSGTNRFVIKDGGNVGIGTANPTERLVVAADTGSGLFMVGNECGSNYIAISLTGTLGDTCGTGYNFLAGDGNLYINTPSTSGSTFIRENNNNKVEFPSISAQNSIILYGKSTAEGGQIAFAPGSSYSHWYFFDNYPHEGSASDLRAMRGTSSSPSNVLGWLQDDANGWFSTSDRRLKTNVQTLDNVLDRIQLTRGVSYDWIDGSMVTQIGVIAQELKEAFPIAVPRDETQGFLGVNYDAVAAIALQGVKELDTRTRLSTDSEIFGGLSLNANGDLAIDAGDVQTYSLNVSGDLVANNLTLGGTNLNDRLVGLESGFASTSASLTAPLQTQIASLNSQFSTLTERVASLEAQLQQITADDQSPDEFEASSSAELSLDSLEVNGNILTDSLSVLGYTTMNELSVTGSIRTGVLTIKGQSNGGASISTLNGDLRLQDQGFGGIDILDGLVTIDTSGNIQTEGTITAKKFNVDTSSVSGASAGSVTIDAGDTIIDVDTTALTTDSLIFVTPNKPVVIGAERKDANTFTIRLKQTQSTNIKVNWWIVN